MKKILIDFLIQLKNCSILKKETFTYKYSKLILKIVNLLYSEGFIQSFKIEKTANYELKIIILLRYFFNKPIFNNLTIISKPTKSKFFNIKELSQFSNKKNVGFVSTNRGIFTLEECKKKKTGGKLLFFC